MFTTLLPFLGLLATATAHGVIVSPPPRAPGPSMSSVCGSTIYGNQASDPAGPVQLLLQSASSITDDSACDLWLCKGYQFADNTANVQTYTRGQTVSWEVDIRAPHTGYANVSIVDTKSNSVIGSALKSWDVYASTSTGVQPEDTSFDITVPEDLEGCTSPGDCVMQWFWYSPPGVDQTYEGCVDFVVAGGTAAPTAPVTSAIEEVTSTAAPVVPTTTTVLETSTAVESVATSEAGIPTVSSVVIEPTSEAAVPTVSSAVIVPTTSAAADIPTTSAVVVAPTSTAAPTTSAVVAPTTSVAPTTFLTRTRTSSTVVSAPSAPATAPKTPESINKCLDEANRCIAKAQSVNGGAVDFSACEAARKECY